MATKKRPAAAPSDRCDDCGKPATYRCNTTGRVDGTARCGDEALVSGPGGVERWIRDKRMTDGQLMAALRRMPMEQRHLIEDRFLSRFPVKAIAVAYGCNHKTMVKRINRALDVLWDLAADLP